MPLRDQIQKAQQEALRAKDSARLTTLRLLWSAIRTEEINERKELGDIEIVAVVSRQVKQLEDALRDFTAANRQDLIDKGKQEIELLKTYLPTQLTDEELTQYIKQAITAVNAATVKDIGRVMGVVMKQVQGKADGNRVRAIANQLLPQ